MTEQPRDPEDRLLDGISEGLSISAETEPLRLVCRQCKAELVIPLAEFIPRVKQHGPYLCMHCPDHPELQVYKADKYRIMMAGFNFERERQGISESGMQGLLDRFRDARRRAGKK